MAEHIGDGRSRHGGAIGRSLGCEPILWTREGRDWAIDQAATDARRPTLKADKLKQ